MKYFSVSLLILIMLMSCQEQPKNYIDIPRTKISIVKPEGYTLMRNTTGFQKSMDETIMVLDVEGGDYYTNASDFTQKYFESQGLKVFDFKETEVDGYPARIMISNSDNPGMNSMSMAFGDSTFSAVITSIHSAKNKELEKKLKAIFLSIRYKKDKTIDPYENIDFAIDSTSSIFKLSSYSANMYTYTPYGREVNLRKISSIISITPSLYDKSISLPQLSEANLQNLQSNGIFGVMKDSVVNFPVEGGYGLLTTGDCYLNLDQLFYYQLILSKNDFCLIVLGICSYENGALREEIEKFCSKVKMTG